MKDLVNHHTIPVATYDQIDWHLRHLFTDGWTTVEPVTAEEHKARHTDGRSAVQWVDNLNGKEVVVCL